MTVKGLIATLTQQEDLNFLLTNRVPRAALTRFMGWFSKIEQPLIRDLSIACWRLFSDLDLSEARKTSFKSLHDCFTRELRPGLRPPDPDPRVAVSPCDAIIGAFGAIADTELFQIKGAAYSLLDLLGDPTLVDAHRNGRFVTLRLTSSMYHRFHAPHDCHIEQVTFISGDTWNVNPIALKRIEKLFCKNERAVIRTRLESGEILTLVPVAAILVASIRLHFLDIVLNAATPGPAMFPCDVGVRRMISNFVTTSWSPHGFMPVNRCCENPPLPAPPDRRSSAPLPISILPLRGFI
jgi:phosphatidylserine decarboxylase